MQPNNAQSDQFLQLADRLKSANNVLVTVSNSPSVDQLAACIGLTIALNKQGKHATAVFSGKIPSTIEFLKPEDTIETNTNSLRDFIIALDKSKADKLRYKVEDDFVKIFITPYRTSISQDDLDFSQGDFNIDLIITLGVHERGHLDQAIVAHGRILHDATVASINTDSTSDLGPINWVEGNASSLCEMVTDLVLHIDKNLLDEQISTALLTGMVAETDRFGNEKARPHTMSVSGVLMAAGASPQLISNKLSEPVAAEGPGDEIPEVVENGDSTNDSGEGQPDNQPSSNDGSLRIEHQGSDSEEPSDDIHIDDDGKLRAIQELEEAQKQIDELEARDHDVHDVKREFDQPPEMPANDDQADKPSEVSRSIVTEPPQLGGRLTANDLPEHQQYSPSTDPLSPASPQPLLDRTEAEQPTEPEEPEITPPEAQDHSDQTLSDIEKAVNSVHLTQQADTPAESPSEPEGVPAPPPVDDARAAVEQAMNSNDTYKPEPINALGATPVNLDLGNGTQLPAQEPAQEEPTSPDQPQSSSSNNGNAPPPVPPPLMPPGV